ncbi:TetR/AcrR family transcriptional regulator [Cognatishimia sp. D5M38]|uniref:TetR/AcrR family transcriptional regulator n=1 Tax=Cognatishimia coralii TaxID=3083254 RepID=A0ABU8QFI7_9RHOB
MSKRKPPTLVRDDPARAPLVGNVKVTREDWLNLARNVLVDEGVGEIKIAILAEKLGVSRSSFYWYFENRRDLLEALLQEWETRNTKTLVSKCGQPSRTISEGACNFFRCFVDTSQFDHGLDFAVREWARRDVAVRARIDLADQTRLHAVTEMFLRHGYEAYDAECRARILYYMQIGYHALDVRESMDVRFGRVAGYLNGFTGKDADPEALEEFRAFAMAHAT